MKEIGNQDVQRETVHRIGHHQHDELAQHGAETAADQHQYDEIYHGRPPQPCTRASAAASRPATTDSPR
jgi:hypothetical protein